ncbi:M13 family metallopeptidase [Micrococcoides hystricis]|uniref:M13 family metallopeptidase n=1 Tax=Micrococcoides hystricis TaxID=1572761 RepID=A0ABV6PB64_9MICC
MTDTIVDPLTAHADNSVRPQDDLYRHINGSWLANHQIPADQGSYGSFIELRDASIEAVKELAEEAITAVADGNATDVQARIAKLYGSFMNEDAVEAAGANPIQPVLQRIDTATTAGQLARILGELAKAGVPSPFAAGSMQDAGDTSRILWHLIQGGLGLPDESYYRDEQYAQAQSGYRQLLTTLFQLGGVENPSATAESVYALEEKMAAHHWDRVKLRDAHARYNLMTREQVIESFPVLADWLAGAGLDEKLTAEMVVWQPDYLVALNELFTDENLDDFKAWAKAAALRSFAPYLSGAFVDANFDFYGKQLAGTEQLRERYKRGVDLINGGLGEDVAQLYVAKHFPAGHKAAMDELVDMLIKAYHNSISSLEWMSPETRERALEKLGTFRPMVGYPVKWIDYSSVELSDDLVANVMAVNAFEFERDVAKIEDGPDPEEWHMTPQTVNAYYAPLENAIVFPAAILQQPFFHPDRDAAYNYGAIGAVIGHEIGHGFDDQGSKYGGDGVLRDWWTDADREAFTERTKVLIDQYAALEPAETPGSYVNGELTLGENIGDLGGLGIAYQAYQLHLAEVGEEPSAENDKKFFAAWAECWRQLTRPETMKVRLATDPHSPNEFRCNQIVKNLDAFHEAFQTQPGDGLWMDPAERVTIW